MIMVLCEQQKSKWLFPSSLAFFGSIESRGFPQPNDFSYTSGRTTGILISGRQQKFSPTTQMDFAELMIDLLSRYSKSIVLDPVIALSRKHI